MNTQKIEQIFTMANKIAFYPTRNLKKEPSVVGLEFHENLLREAMNCYSDLKEGLTQRDLVLALKKEINAIKAAIISKSKGEVISFRVGKEKGLNEFTAETNSNHPFAFVILRPSNNLPNIVADSNQFQPIVFDKYVLTE